jgi:hypothetical protein
LPATPFLGTDAPAVITSNLLAHDDQENLIKRGFPARLRFSAELWPAAGFGSRSLASASWDVIVAYDPLDRVYRVARITPQEGIHSLGSFASFAEVRGLLSLPYQPGIRAPVTAAPGPGRFYYSVTLEVERITENDLAEMRSWLGTAIGPERNAGGAIFSFFGSLITRLIGAEKKRHEARSAVFRLDGEEDPQEPPGWTAGSTIGAAVCIICPAR